VAKTSFPGARRRSTLTMPVAFGSKIIATRDSHKMRIQKLIQMTHPRQHGCKQQKNNSPHGSMPRHGVMIMINSEHGKYGKYQGCGEKRQTKKKKKRR
jgi:hypothetical protein